MDIQATGFPSKQCFCNPGWFGRNCSRREVIIPLQMCYMHLHIGSSLLDALIIPEDYSIYRQLSPRLSLYAKLVTADNVGVYNYLATD